MVRSSSIEVADNNAGGFFLGSSAVRAALDQADQLELFPAVEGEYHPQCILFEQLLKEQMGQKHLCFNFAIKGSVTSDQYMILSVLRQMHSLPNIVIYGVTARDFINNGLCCPASTPTYQFLDQCFDIGKRCSKAYATKDNSFCPFMIEHLYFLRESKKFQTLLVTGWKRVFSNYNVEDGKTPDCSRKAMSKFPSGSQLERDEYSHFPSQGQKANFLFGRKGFITRDLQQYELIYKPFPDFSYKQQLSYFDQILALCKNEGVQLIIVNMPSTYENREILGKEHYENYLSDIKNRALVNSFTFIDMNDLEKFSSGNFYDSLHLNSIGSKIFITRLARYLCAQSDLIPIASDEHNQTWKQPSVLKKKSP